jgi:hypothetical protein
MKVRDHSKDNRLGLRKIPDSADNPAYSELLTTLGYGAYCSGVSVRRGYPWEKEGSGRGNRKVSEGWDDLVVFLPPSFTFTLKFQVPFAQAQALECRMVN